MEALTPHENNQLDSIIKEIRGNTEQTQQYAIEAAHLLSATQDRLDEYKNYGFFGRIWSAISGNTGAMQRANQADLIKVQSLSFSFLNNLQKQNLMLPQT